MIPVEDIRAALAAATPGPWVGAVPADDETDTAGEYLRNTLHDPDAHASHVHAVWSPTETERIGDGHNLIIAYTGDGPTSYANRELIASAPTWLAELLAEVDRLTSRALPDPKGGCVCESYSEDRGGGYFESMVEYEPACPEHSEHVYNPRSGVWEFDAAARAETAEQAVKRVRCLAEYWAESGNSWRKGAARQFLRALDGGAS